MTKSSFSHLLGLSSLAVYTGWSAIAPSVESGAYYLVFGVCMFALFVLYCALLYTARQIEPAGGKSGPSSVRTLIIYALVARVILLFAGAEGTPLSDDVYRYVWEGKVVANGYNPYIHSPEAMRSSGLADSDILPKINHSELPSIYPPLAQALFAASWLATGDSLTGFRTLSFLFELSTLFLIILLVRQYRLPEWTMLLYAFSPLVLIEFGYSSHLDILGLPFLTASLIFLKRKQPMYAGLFLALSALVKLLTVILLPVLLIHFAGRRRFVLLLAFIGACAVGYLPFAFSAGPNAFGSLWTYLGTWEHNGSIFALLSGLVGSGAARGIAASLFIIAGVTIVSRTKRDNEKDSENIAPETAMLWTLAGFLLLTSTVYPWYLVWLIPFLLIKRVVAMLVFTATVFLSYYSFLETGTSAAVFTLVEYLPVYTLIIWQMFTNGRHTRKEFVLES